MTNQFKPAFLVPLTWLVVIATAAAAEMKQSINQIQSGYTHLVSGNYDDAIRELTAAVYKNPHDALARKYLAQAFKGAKLNKQHSESFDFLCQAKSNQVMNGCVNALDMRR